MKKIVAVIRDENADTLRSALMQIGIRDVSVIPVHQLDLQEPLPGRYSGSLFVLLVEDRDVCTAVRVLARENRAGPEGEGMICVCPVITAIDLGTSDRPGMVLR